jgi:hypothetical protein
MYTDPSGNAPYDRMAAASYALQWYNLVNPEYGVMGDSDCTSFVSQALKAGGFLEDDIWFFDEKGFEPWERGCTGYHPNYDLLGLTPTAPYLFAHDIGKPFCGVAWGLTEDLFDYFTTTMRFQVVAEIEGTEPPTGLASGRIIPGNGEYIEFPVTVSIGDVVFYTQNHTDHLQRDPSNRFNHAAFIVGWGPLYAILQPSFCKIGQALLVGHSSN